MGRMLAAAALAAAAGAAAYELDLRPWQERWGALDDEVDLPLPGDHLVADPATQITRGITIDAPPSAVWPWLVQIGADRGGFYSYDGLEDAFGLDIHSADEIVPEWQDLAVGDLVRADRKGSGGWYVVELIPNQALVLQLANLETGEPARRDEGLRWEFLWTFAIRVDDLGRTRLLVRERTAFDRKLTKWALSPVGVVSFFMTRRMLQGVRARAEAAYHRPRQIPAEWTRTGTAPAHAAA